MVMLINHVVLSNTSSSFITRTLVADYNAAIFDNLIRKLVAIICLILALALLTSIMMLELVPS